MKNKKRMSVSDKIIVSIIIVVALLGVIFVSTASGGGPEVEISVGGEVYKTVALNSDKKQEIRVNDTNVVVVENGAARMESSDCVDQECIKQATIQNEGESIICGENDIVVTIKKNIDAEEAAW